MAYTTIALDIAYNTAFADGFSPQKAQTASLEKAILPVLHQLANNGSQGCIYGASTSGQVIFDVIKNTGYEHLLTEFVDLAQGRISQHRMPVIHPQKAHWANFIILAVSPSTYFSVLQSLPSLIPADSILIFPWSFEFFDPEIWLTQQQTLPPLPPQSCSYQVAKGQDLRGELFFHHDRVLRRISGQDFAFYHALLTKEERISSLTAHGLVPTKLLSSKEKSQAKFPPEAFVVEHAPLLQHRAENWTMTQFLTAAQFFISWWKFLYNAGYSLQDCHMENVMFSKNHPVFVDLCSIGPQEATTLSPPFVEQFFASWVTPAALLASNQHQIFRTALKNPYSIETAKAFLTPQVSLQVEKLEKTGQKLLQEKNIPAFCTLIQSWIKTVQVNQSSAGWNGENYQHEALNTPEPSTQKEHIFCELLTKYHPTDVLDMGCNKGRFALLSTQHGVPCTALDTAESLIDKLFLFAREQQLPLTPFYWNIAKLNNFSTPEKQFDMVVYFAIVHHLIFSANMTVQQVIEQAHALCRHTVVLEYIKPCKAEKFVYENYSPHIHKEYTPEAITRRLHYFFPHIHTIEISASRLLLIAHR